MFVRIRVTPCADRDHLRARLEAMRSRSRDRLHGRLPIQINIQTLFLSAAYSNDIDMLRAFMAVRYPKLEFEAGILLVDF